MADSTPVNPVNRLPKHANTDPGPGVEGRPDGDRNNRSVPLTDPSQSGKFQRIALSAKK